MYTQDFYITEPVGNNAFSYKQRKNKQLYVPSLRKIESFDELELLNPVQYLSPTLSSEEREQASDKITFEDYDFDDTLQSCYGLKYLYELEYNPYSHNTSPSVPLLTGEGSKNIPLYLVDNHNHAHYFWYLARSQGLISDGARVYHIDAHADMRDPWVYLSKSESYDMQKVFDYTNFTLNVGNFIVPAMREWLVGEVVQIRGEEDLYAYLGQAQDLPLQDTCRDAPCGYPDEKQSIILDLDLDFFAPEMDYIDFELAKHVILNIASRADLITICTSPFFIKQERALRFLREIFT